MALLEAEPRDNQDNGETARPPGRSSKDTPTSKGYPRHLLLRPPGTARAIDELGLKRQVFTAGTGMPAANARSSRTDPSPPDPVGPANAGYAMLPGHKILRGDAIEDGVNLGVEGYENMHFSPGPQGPRRNAGSRSPRTTSTPSASETAHDTPGPGLHPGERAEAGHPDTDATVTGREGTTRKDPMDTPVLAVRHVQ